MQLCPHCGYNLSQDKAVVRGDWELLPDQALYHGVPVKLSRMQAGILYTLARAAPRTVSADAIAERIGSEASDARNMVTIQIARIRSRLGHKLPVDTIFGVGYRWAA